MEDVACDRNNLIYYYVLQLTVIVDFSLAVRKNVNTVNNICTFFCR